MLDALADTASVNGGAFTRAQALAAGYAPRQLRRMVDSGLWVRLRHGVMVDGGHLLAASERDLALLEIAAARLTLTAPTVGGGRSAAAAHGLPLLSNSSTVHLLGPAAARGGTQKRPILVRRATVPPDHRTALNGVPLTTVARTICDLSATLPLLDFVVTADAALHQKLTSVEELVQVAEVSGALPSLIQVLHWCDGRSESPLESISRVVLLQHGIEPPELQYELRDAAGRLIARVDFWWSQRVAGESDGLSKYETPEDLRLEKLRQEAIEQQDCRVVRWTYDEITKTPQVVVDRVRWALARAPG